ncbi:MAG: hypothetical protein CSA72_09335 [Rhodobacterales bacterium]|nr:MAG: hypothetical protein CSA72_09335 [Rhodobacterales bacterium]
MIRPEARATLWRWREALAALPLLALGVRWALSTGLMPWLGGLTLALGLFLLFTGLQRARFRHGSGGAGVVETDERQLSYLSAHGGAALAFDTISAVMLIPGDPVQWQLSARTGERLTIPSDATGADQLFDAFAALPGFPTEQMLRLLAHPPEAAVTIWRRGPPPVDSAGNSAHP